MEIKAIETEYNGYRFRSRLEARWAVFFDAAGIKYEYEPEGFEVKVNSKEIYRYLPDFYLPDFDLWVEVKPSKSKLMDEEKKLCVFLKYDTQIARSNGLIILGQIPNYVEYDEDNEKCFFPAFPLFWSSSLIASSKVQFAKLDKIEGIVISTNVPYDFQTSNELRFPDFPFGEDLYLITTKVKTHDKYGYIWNMSETQSIDCTFELKECFLKARRARFEHGETPEVSK